MFLFNNDYQKSMNFKKPLILFIFFSSFILFSQQSKVISGKITAEKKELPDIIVAVQTNKTLKFGITDKNGNYKFTIVDYKIEDSLYLQINIPSFKLYLKKLNNLPDNLILNINLEESSKEILKEVVIQNRLKIVNTAKKSSYKVNNKDFIKNAKADEVLQTIPNLYVNEDKSVMVDGKLNSKIFVDGIDVMSNELKNIDAESIDRVEVINNPNSSFGTDFLGAIINMITKKNKEEFVKGSLSAIVGIVNNYRTINPMLSYKRGKITLKSDYQYLENHQIVDFKSFRKDENGTFFQNNRNRSTNFQPSLETKLNIKFSEKSNLTFSNSLNGYKFTGNASGVTVANVTETNNFTKKGTTLNQTSTFGAVLQYQIKENRNFYIKGVYNNYLKNDVSILNFNKTNDEFFKIQTKSKEFSSNLVYEAEELKILKKSSAYYSDIKYINRNFDFFDSNFFVKQSILNFSNEIDTEWTEKLSTEIALTLENTRNYNQTLDQSYNLILPTINALYHLKNKIDAKFGYSRKVLRPSSQDLNEDIIVTYPGLAKQGNVNLNPQIRNYYYIMFNKAVKQNNFSLKIYNELIKNSIEEVYKKQDDLLVQTLANAARFNSLGINLGLRTKILKKILINFNTGLDYNVFESTNSIIKKSAGYTFRGSLNLNTKLFKDLVSVSFSGRQSGPEYSLLSKRITLPYLFLSLGTNLFKNKLNIQLYAQHLLGKSATGFTDISSFENFYQKIEGRNNSRNLLISLTYTFGKKFDDDINDKNINNDDIRN